MSALSELKHIVVLMLENRSFDSMLGDLARQNPQVDGLSGAEFCLDRGGRRVQVWTADGADPCERCFPRPDPGEFWTDMNSQLFGTTVVPTPAPVPGMGGFVTNYQTQGDGSNDPKQVMHFYSCEQVPVITRLATQFAVSDRWHASAPCQTWPNRFFAHTGTAGGYENNSPTHFPYTMPTIFNRLTQVGKDWRVYFHDMPQSLTLQALWSEVGKFRFFDEFKIDAANGQLPDYSFIEPRYFADIRLPNDQHPPHSVAIGEELISDVYRAVRNGPHWTNTLLVVTYDEHGGCFDHVPPPAAVPPTTVATAPFNFDRYGVRVPAVFVSPYIKPGTVLRPPANVPFDHTSIISSLRKHFELGAPLTNRDAVAPDFLGVMSLEQPNNMGPEAIDGPVVVPTPAELNDAKSNPLNGMQRALLELARRLPGADGTMEGQVLELCTSEGVIAGAAGAIAEDTAARMTMAVAAARSRLHRFLASPPQPQLLPTDPPGG